MRHRGKLLVRHAATLASLAGFLLTTGAAGAQQGQAQPRGYVSSFTGHDELDASLLRPALQIGDVNEWVKEADLPDQAFTSMHAQTHLRIMVDASDKIESCAIIRASASEAVDQLACALIGQRGHFRHAFSAAGKPAQGSIDIYLNFGKRPMVTAPMPPAPPAGGWPYTPGLSVVHEPDWRHFATPGMPDGELAVSLDIYPPSGGRAEARYCRPSDYRRDDPLTLATCAAVKAAEYAPLSESAAYGRHISMLVRWKKGRASYKLPSQTHSTPLVILNQDIIPEIHLPAGFMPGGAGARVTFAPDGHVRCTVLASTGNDEADLHLCASLKRLRFTPEIDIFGRKVPTTHYYHFDR